jgi:hypothetical protein
MYLYTIYFIYYSTEKKITRGGPQYDTLLNIQYKQHMRAIAFAVDLMIMVRAESIGEQKSMLILKLTKL